jgi:phage tail sheath protein FI
MATRPGVYVTESVLNTPVATQPAAGAAGALVGPLPEGPTAPTLVTSWYQFSQLFGGLNTNYVGTFSANLFFRSGGAELYVTRVVKSDAVAATGILSTSTATTWITFTAKGKGTYGNSLRVQVVKNVNNLYDITVLKEAGVADTIAAGLATANTGDDTVLESFTNLDHATYGSADVVNILGVRSQYVNATWNVASSALAITAATSVVVALSAGATGAAADDYTTPFALLAAIDRAFVVFCPGIVDVTTLSALDSFATTNKGFAVIDTAAGVIPSAAVTYAGTLTASTYSGVYYPHLWIPDSTSASRDAIRLVPPSGAVAGSILSTDASRGVFKAPAGIETVIPGVVALERTLSAAELDALNSDVSPVNAIRFVSGVGPAIMGARTLKQTASTRYVNIRRSLSYLDRELKNRLEFAVFRNNDLLLWNQMKTVLDSFLTGYWTAGGLRGNTKAQAYYIKIDGENNSSADIANGIVNVEVGVAVQYPAEFIKVQLTQQTLS